MKQMFIIINHESIWKFIIKYVNKTCNKNCFRNWSSNMFKTHYSFYNNAALTKRSRINACEIWFKIIWMNKQNIENKNESFYNAYIVLLYNVTLLFIWYDSVCENWLKNNKWLKISLMNFALKRKCWK